MSCKRNKICTISEKRIVKTDCPDTKSITKIAATSETSCELYDGLSKLDPNFIERMHALRYTLTDDLMACDAKWTIFVAAALSYCYESFLRPFPPRFISEDGFKIDELIDVINETPKLGIVLQQLIQFHYNDCSIDVLELLFWVLVHKQEPEFRSVDEDEYDTLMDILQMPKNLVRPTHIFEINDNPESEIEANFQKLSKQHQVKLAYFPTNLNSVYAIVHNGFEMPHCLQPLRLTDDLETCLENCSLSAGWGCSYCGALIACFGLCEVITPSQSTDNRIKDAGDAGPNVEEEIAEYTSWIRLRYLFFYGTRFPKERQNHGVLKWLSKNKFLFDFISYVFMFGAIGVGNTTTGIFFKNLVIKKFELAIDFFKRVLFEI